MKLKNYLLIIFAFITISAQIEADKFQCLPCGRKCDKTIRGKSGICPECQMELVPSSSVTFKNIPPNEVYKYLQENTGTILLDVRTNEEFTGKAEPDFGTLPNAINIPLQELEKNIDKLNDYKNRTIIVYCSHGHRSAEASYKLSQLGFHQVFNISGGMSVFPKH